MLKRGLAYLTAAYIGLCTPMVAVAQARKKRGMKLPPECEYYDPNQTNNPLLEVTKEDLDQKISEHLEIIDGFRSFGYNTRMYWALGKIPTSSYHCSGNAIDIRVNPRKVGAVVNQLFEHDGLGVGGNFIHIDTRGTKARWYYHFGKKKKK